MASDAIWGPKSLPASADLSSYQFCFMKLNTSGQLALPAANGYAIGVLQDKPTAQAQPGMVCRPGDITKIVCGEGITAGEWVATNSSGRAILCVTGDWILGQALDACASGSITRMVYQPLGKMA